MSKVDFCSKCGLSHDMISLLVDFHIRRWRRRRLRFYECQGCQTANHSWVCGDVSDHHHVFFCGDQNRYSKPNLDVFLTLGKCLFVPKPKQSISTVLWPKRNSTFNLNICKSRSINIQWTGHLASFFTAGIITTASRGAAHQEKLFWLL